MPLKLSPPDAKHPTYRVRGTYLGVSIDRATGATDKKVASGVLAKWKAEIERGAYAKPQDPTFASAALSYVHAGGEKTFLGPLADYFGERLLHTIKQADIDAAAVDLYPNATPATRNRQVYTPVSAVLRHAGVTIGLRRPKGAQGTPRTAWLSPHEAFALLAAARALEPRFGALCMFLLYTGCRLGEALRVRTGDLELQRGFAYVGKTKNGDPRPVHLPPQVVAEIANLSPAPAVARAVAIAYANATAYATVFGYHKSGHLYGLLAQAAISAGVRIPERVAFHIFRHTYGAWMRRYSGLDTSGLVATGAWKSRQAAAVYEHVDTNEEARKADLLPTWRAK